ncbi:MAG: hypothetical protein ACYS14_04625, partial [Planctomycetota bacterium]
MKELENPAPTSTARMTRRQMLRRTAAISGTVAVPWIIPSFARGSDSNAAPSGRITVGLIGRGIMGRGHLRRLVGDRDVHVPAVCDVDRLRRDQGKKL